MRMSHWCGEMKGVKWGNGRWGEGEEYWKCGGGGERRGGWGLKAEKEFFKREKGWTLADKNEKYASENGEWTCWADEFPHMKIWHPLNLLAAGSKATQTAAVVYTVNLPQEHVELLRQQPVLIKQHYLPVWGNLTQGYRLSLLRKCIQNDSICGVL